MTQGYGYGFHMGAQFGNHTHTHVTHSPITTGLPIPLWNPNYRDPRPWWSGTPDKSSRTAVVNIEHWMLSTEHWMSAMNRATLDHMNVELVLQIFPKFIFNSVSDFSFVAHVPSNNCMVNYLNATKHLEIG
jgi:hypothetical protein